MTSARITAEFVGTNGNKIFLVAHHPVIFNGRCVLVCPPFAEEMNKSRKMVADLSRLLFDRGMAVVIPDLFGTGDSEGDFDDACWNRWCTDLQATEQWINDRGWYVESLLGIRLGCVLATQYMGYRLQSVVNTVFWQPVVDGARVLEQFLRLRVAASLMNDNKESVADLKSRIAKGETIEIAGYGLSPKMARDLDVLKLEELATAKMGKLHWFEILRSADSALPLTATKAIDQLKQKLHVLEHRVVGEPFWSTAEIISIPALLAETATALCGGEHG